MEKTKIYVRIIIQNYEYYHKKMTKGCQILETVTLELGQNVWDFSEQSQKICNFEEIKWEQFTFSVMEI